MHSFHMLHVLQFAVLHGPSWKQFQITVFHLTTESIHLATVPTVVIKFLPKCLVHIHDQVASYEMLDNKHTLPNWTSCTTFKAVMYTYTHWNPHWFLPLLSPTQCWQCRTISILWTTLYILHAQMSAGKYSRSTKICSVFINIQYIDKTWTPSVDTSGSIVYVTFTQPVVQPFCRPVWLTQSPFPFLILFLEG